MTSRNLAPALKTLILLLAAGVCGCASAAAGPNDGGSAATAALLGTDWNLSSLDGKPLQLAEGQRQPHLSLREKDQRIAGSLGCNAVNGSYVLNGVQLSFGPMISTRMACLKGMDIEHDFAAALRNAASWKISGQQLELYDAAGQPLARFEPRPAP